MADYTVLLIDYEPRSIAHARQALSSAGFAVEVATDGIAGVEAFHRLHPDLVLVEAMLPKKHGFEVCRELKATPEGKRTPVILASSVYKGRKYRTEALHIHRCDEFLEKPISQEDLVKVCLRLLGASIDQAKIATPPPAPAPAEAPARAPAEALRGVEHDKDRSFLSEIVSELTEEDIVRRLDDILVPEAQKPSQPQPPVETPIEVTPSAAPVEADPGIEVAEESQETIAPDEMEWSTPYRSSPQDQEEVPQDLLDALDRMDGEPPVSEKSSAVGPSSLPVEPRAAAPASPAASVEVPDHRGEEDGLAPEVSLSFWHEAVANEPAAEPTVTERPSPPPRAAREDLVSIDAGPADRSAEVTPPVRRADSRVTTPEHRRTDTPHAVQELGAQTEQPQDWRSTRHEEKVATPRMEPSAERAIWSEPSPKRSGIWVFAASLLVAGLAGTWFLATRSPSGEPVEDGRPVLQSPISPERTPSAPAPTARHDGGAPPPRIARAATKPPVASPVAPVAAAPSAATGLAVSVADPPSAPRSEPIAPATEPPASPTGAPTPSLAEPDSGGNALAQPDPGREAAPSGFVEPPQPAESAVPRVPVPVESPSEPPVVLKDEPSAAPQTAPGSLVSLDDVDSPPQAVLRRLPSYTAQARLLRQRGTVVLKVLVDEEGRVSEVDAVQRIPGSDLNDAAVAAAKSWTYQPATKGGVPVKVWIVERVSFNP